MFQLPELPYPKTALEPYMSAETLEFHHGKHHKAYVEKLNQLVQNTPLASMSLEEVVLQSEGAVFNNAAQAWNHTFFWNCLSPQSGERPTGELIKAIEQNFGSFEQFKSDFSKQAIGLFGSGWTWLVCDRDARLAIVPLGNAGNPMTKEQIPLLTLDVWEHAYYIDYRNARANFVDAFWRVINWGFVEMNYSRNADEFSHIASARAGSDPDAQTDHRPGYQ